MLAYAYTFTLGGALLRVFHPRPIPGGSSRLARSAVLFSRRRRRMVLAVWVAILAAAPFGLARLRVEPSYKHMLAPGHPEGEAFRAMERALDAELIPFEVYLEARTPRQRHPNELVGAAIGLERYLRTLPETRIVVSAATLLDELVATDPEAARAMGDPALLERLRSGMSPPNGEASFVEDPVIATWLRLDRGVSRAQVLFRPMTMARREELLGWITHYAATSTIGYRVTFGGPGYLMHVVEREGLRGIVWGAVCDLLLLTLIMALFLRRARLASVALLGNIAPVIALCAIMGFAGIPWSFDLLGLPVLVLGLAVDDTVHLLWPLRRVHRRRTEGSAFQRSIRAYGVAVVATSVLLASSLAGLSLSGFGVNRELGILLPAGLLLALAAELTLIPAALARSQG
jgi:predicted RND superfamily exporter protein